MPYRTEDYLIRPSIVEPINTMMTEIYRQSANRLVVSIGVKPGVLVGGRAQTMATPVGYVYLFEDDGQ